MCLSKLCALILHLDKRPSLQLADRFAFSDPYRIAKLGSISLIVHIIFLLHDKSFLVQRMHLHCLYKHDTSLRSLIADNFSYEFLDVFTS